MPKILVIDDNPDILKLIVDILKSNDYEVTAAPGGEAGIRELESDNYAMVLTDLIMPDVSGMEVLEHLIAKSPKTMCIILTGHGSIKARLRPSKKGLSIISLNRYQPAIYCFQLKKH